MRPYVTYSKMDLCSKCNSQWLIVVERLHPESYFMRGSKFKYFSRLVVDPHYRFLHLLLGYI